VGVPTYTAREVDEAAAGDSSVYVDDGVYYDAANPLPERDDFFC